MIPEPAVIPIFTRRLKLKRKYEATESVTTTRFAR